MLDTLEGYSRDLERLIKAKKMEYRKEQKRADDINFKPGIGKLEKCAGPIFHLTFTLKLTQFVAKSR